MTYNEPINYLDSVLQEEELRWRMEEFGNDRRKYSISRSGRYKSINKKRDALKPELFKGTDADKMNRQSTSKDNSTHHHQQVHQQQQYQYQQHQQQYQHQQQQAQSSYTRTRDRDEKYSKFYETNL